MKRISLVLFFVLAIGTGLASPPQALFYLTSKPDSIRSFLAHSAQIDLLVPAWYQVDEDGLVTGAPQPTVAERARQEHLAVMPLVAMFTKDGFHKLATHPESMERFRQALVRESRLHGYIGFQLDIENVDYRDRDLLSALVAQTAEALHSAGLKISIATVPNAPGYPGEGGFSRWIYTDWRGAYDLAALGRVVDLVCLMTYDQHTRWTTPGPVAGWQWMTENLRYALQFVGREKLSLGIPLYGYHWQTAAPTRDSSGTEHPAHGADYISNNDAMQLIDGYGGHLAWDEQDRSSYAFFYRDQMREWIFLSDARGFAERYRLVQEEHLQGFCSWVLGEEDPSIWTQLPQRAAR